MTSYIDNPVAGTSHAATPSVRDISVTETPGFSALPIEAYATAITAFWTLPLASMRFWTQGWSALVAAGREPETDRHDDTPQLPVPNPLQQSRDKELFA